MYVFCPQGRRLIAVGLGVAAVAFAGMLLWFSDIITFPVLTDYGYLALISRAKYR